MTTRHSLVSLALVTLAAVCAGACSPAASSPKGSGGNSSSGGNSGSGGSGAGGKTLGADCINNPADIIADFTSDNGVKAVDGREGGFYTYGDNSEKSGTPLAVLTPAEGTTPPVDSATGNTECSGPGSLRVTATGFAIWGAALGTNFGPADGSYKGWYDASKYKGISFWAKAATALTGVQVSFPDVYTDGGANAKDVDSTVTDVCVYGPATNNCSPYLVKFGDPDYPNYMDSQIDTSWKRFDVMFADTQQDKNNAPGYLLPAIGHVDLQHLTSMAIQVNAIHNMDSTVTANDFDIWIDDVNFIR